MNGVAYCIIAAVAAGRLVEVAWSLRNTKKLKARGAVEAGAGHYPLIIALHVAWLGAIVIFLPKLAAIHAIPLVAFAGLQVCRLWVMVSLGAYFTTRIITVPGAPLVRDGPYRFARHPNYLVVMGEILLLPLVFGEVAVAAVFSVLNAAVIFWRIRIEDAALEARR